MTDLSIIIVCYRGWGRLVKCLEALNGFKRDKFSYEVIVVDNKSADDNIFNIKKSFPGFHFISNKVNGGFANGNNLGIKYANGEFLLILNPDTITSENEIDKLLNRARSNPEYSIFSCRQVNERGKDTRAFGDFPTFWNLTGFQRSFLKITRGGEGKIPSAGTVFSPDWISGSVVLVRKDLYLKTGGFYEGFWMYYEDVDLCKRVSDGGGKIAFLSDITIEHNHGGSSRIDIRTTSITKNEVKISQHLYISRNFKSIERVLSHVFLVVNNLISAVFMAIIGIIFFFVPKLFVRTIMFFKLIQYYTGSFFYRSWISPRSVLKLPGYS